MEQRRRIVPAVTAALFLYAAPVPADAPPPAGGHGFQSFCAEWMAKLRAREADNARATQIVKNGSGFIGEFTGYGRKPLKCRAKPTGSASTPWVGQIVYEEIVYRVSGRSAKAARSSTPVVAGRQQVLEIFKFDGSKWIY
jgi:hypothetical protein